MESPAQNSQPATGKKVIIYGAEWCGYCHQAMSYFDRKGVAYSYHDIEKEADAAKELIEKLGGPVQGVPVIDVYGEVILGYDIARINRALEAGGPVAAAAA